MHNQRLTSMAAPAPIVSNNGCVSEISSETVHAAAHDYTSAMKSYGLVYEQYQSYLMPSNQLLPHDYDLNLRHVVLTSHLGCLNEDLLESTLHEEDVSDDDIEGCGYMGWLQHH